MAEIPCPECGFINDAERFCVRCDARLPDNLEVIGPDTAIMEVPESLTGPSSRSQSAIRATVPTRKEVSLVARPEDFPNSILRRVAAGESVGSGGESEADLFTQGDKPHGASFEIAWLSRDSFAVGIPEALHLRLKSLGGALDLEIHLETEDSVQLDVPVRGVRLEQGEPVVVSFDVHASERGAFDITRLEVIAIDRTAQLRVYALTDNQRLRLIFDRDIVPGGTPGLGDQRFEPLTMIQLGQNKVETRLPALIGGAAALATPKTLVCAVLPAPPPEILRIRPVGTNRRIYVFLADPLIRFGRKKPGRTAQGNHLVLRLLPCRSEEEDPANWRMTMAISGVHGGVQHRQNGLFLNNTSRLGTILNGRKLHTNEKVRLPDVFVLMLAGVLRLKGRVFSPTKDAPTLQVHTDLPLPKPEMFDAALRGPVDCLHLQRVANQEDDEYVFVYRSSVFGASPICPIRIPGKGVAPIHARLLRHRGTLLLGVARGGVGELSVEGRTLGRDELVPFVPGMDLQIGEVKLEVEVAKASDLVKLDSDP
ncbi:MAG: FHA domain-containing protein [Planctomycetota bacterium]